MRRSWKAAALAVMVVIVSSCDEDFGCDSKPTAWRAEGPELEVLYAVPDGAAAVPQPLVYAVFNNGVIATSIDAASLRVHDGEHDVEGTVGAFYHPDGTCIGVSCTLDSPLVPGPTYTATLSTDILGGGGDHLDEPYSWTFYLDASGFYEWREPVVLDDEDEIGQCIRPTVVVDGFRPWASTIWLERVVQEDLSYRYNLWARHHDPRGIGIFTEPWSRAYVHVSDSVDDAVPHQATNAIADGIVVLPVRTGESPGHELWLSRWEPVEEQAGVITKEWVQAVRRGASDVPLEHPQVGIDLDGAALVVVAMKGASDPALALYSSHSHLGNRTWGDLELVEAMSPGEVQRPKLAVNESGDAFAVWEVEQHPDPYHLRGGRYVRGAAGTGFTWVGSLDETPFGGVVRDPAVGIDGDGDALVVWAREDAMGSTAWALAFASGAAMPSAPEELSAGLDGEGRTPHISVHPGGRAIAIWVQVTAPLEASLMAMRYVPGEGWRDRTTIWSGNRCEEPYVAMGPGGDAIVVWHYGAEVHASHHLGGTLWSEAEIISRPFAFSDLVNRPRVMIDREGRATAVWQQMDFRWRACCARFE